MAEATARHILVDDESVCEELKTKIQGGADFADKPAPNLWHRNSHRPAKTLRSYDIWRLDCIFPDCRAARICPIMANHKGEIEIVALSVLDGGRDGTRFRQRPEHPLCLA